MNAGSQVTLRSCLMLGWEDAKAAVVQQLLARSLSEVLPMINWPHCFDVLSLSMTERGRQLLKKLLYYLNPWCFPGDAALAGQAPGPMG